LLQEYQTITSFKVQLPWLYPPTFLLVIFPISYFPFYLALLLWLFMTLLLYLVVVCRAAPHPLSLSLALAFPAVFINFMCGQNGFFSAVLLGGGLLLLDRWPRTGGLLLGLMTYKPHLAALIPLALMAGRRWQALGAMAASACAFALLSAAVFGLETWMAFFQSASRLKDLLAAKSWDKMASAFAAVRFLGGNLITAWLFQGMVMLGATAVVAWVWRQGASPALRAAALTLGLLLFSPYLFNYDLAILALPLAWLGWEGIQKGWLPYEPCVLTLAWMAPLFYLPMESRILNNPIAPLACVIMLFLVAWRAVRLRRQAT
jgi:hypothetical protein